MRNVIIFNAESAFFYCRSQTFRRFVSAATELHCDSASLSRVLSVRGISHWRSHGPDFMESVLRECAGERIAIIPLQIHNELPPPKVERGADGSNGEITLVFHRHPGGSKIELL